MSGKQSFSPASSRKNRTARGLAGHIPVGMDATTTFMEFHRAGKIRVLAVSGSRRAASQPDVRTFAEPGFQT